MLGHGQERRRYLAMQLALRDVDVDVLPSGMERAQRNRSYWDSKCVSKLSTPTSYLTNTSVCRGKKAMMTIEFLFNPPPDPYTRQMTKVEPLVAHKLDWNTTVRDMLRSSIKNSSLKRNEHFMQWLSLDDEDNDEQSSVLCLMKPRDPSDPSIQPASSFYKLDWNTPLSKLLLHKQITEFPTIHLTDESVFEGALVEDDGTRTDISHRTLKRRRLDEASGKKAIATLVGGYGSDEDEGNSKGEDDDPAAAVLGTLAEYAGSENGDSEVSYDDELDAEGETDEEYAEAAGMGADSSGMMQDDGDDVVDWGDDEIAEDEAKIASLSEALRQRYPGP